MAGYPIQTPSDQRPVGSSPRPIAAPHVFHRSYVPRHPPYATPSTQPSTTHAYQPQTTLQVLSQMITLKHATPHHPTKTRVTRVWLQTHTHHTGRCMLASTIQLSNHHPTPHNPPPTRGKGTMRRVTTLNHSHGQGTQQRAQHHPTLTHHINRDPS